MSNTPNGRLRQGSKHRIKAMGRFQTLSIKETSMHHRWQPKQKIDLAGAGAKGCRSARSCKPWGGGGPLRAAAIRADLRAQI